MAQEVVSEWKLTEFESIEKAILIARRLGLHVQPVSPHPKGLVAFTVRGPDSDYTIAQALEGGSVKQKEVVRKRKRKGPLGVPPLEDRIIGYRSFFVGHWMWCSGGEPITSGEALVEGEYSAHLIEGTEMIHETLKVGDYYYARIIAPPEEYRRDKERIERIRDEWFVEYRKSKGGEA